MTTSFGQLLSAFDAERPPKIPRAGPQVPDWVDAAISSPSGTRLLALAGVDVVDALKVADMLCRRRRVSARAIAKELDLPVPLVARTRRVLGRIEGLAGLGKSWAPEPTSGALSKVPGWGGRRRWLLAVSLAVLSPTGKAAIARMKSSRPLVMRVARQDADAADGKTGREVRTSHATVAQRLRVTADAVRHARYVLEALGLSVTIVTGRYLTAKERAAARAHHGGRQRRIASTRALTLTRAAAAIVARHLPRSGSDAPPSSDSSGLPRHAGNPPRRRNRPPYPPIGLGWQKLAAQVVQVLPELGRRHVGNLARGLSRLPIDPSEWTGYGLVRLVELRNRDRGYTQPLEVRSLLGLFLHQIRDMLTLSEPTPTLS